MKNIILKVPTFVFLVLVFMPLISWYLNLELIVFKNVLIYLFFLPNLTIIVWLLSVLTYMTEASNSKQYFMPLIIIVLTEFSLNFYTIMGIGEPKSILILYVLLILSLLLRIVTTVLMTKVVKKVFYARSTWFAIIELLFVPIGMFSLTPEIKEWEKGDKV